MAAGGPEVGRELAGPNPLAGRAQTAAAQESMSVADRLPGRCAPVIGERRVLPQRRQVGRVIPCAPTDGRAQRRARSDAPYLLWLAASAVADLLLPSSPSSPGWLVVLACPLNAIGSWTAAAPAALDSGRVRSRTASARRPQAIQAREEW